MKAPLTVLTPPAPRGGDYLDTLERWGSLPQYLPLPDAARLIGHKCKQNPAALLKILEEAVLDDAIAFAGLQSSGEWVPGMVRFFHRQKGKPRIKPSGEGAQMSVALEPGRLHSEAVGVQIGDAVALLAKRGRKLPDELRHLLPEDISERPAHNIAGPFVTKAELIAGLDLVGPTWAERLKRPEREGKRYKPALVQKGKQGDKDGTLWNPVIFARLAAECGHLNRGQVMARFKRKWEKWLPELEAEMGEI